MLSATPVNTSLIDLRNQIYLMTGKREEVFQKSLGNQQYPRFAGAGAKGRLRHGKTIRTRVMAETNRKLLAKLGADFFQLLGGVSIARSRRHIKSFYADEIGRIGAVSQTTETRKPSPTN